VLGLVMGAAVAAGVLGAARRSATLAAPIPAGPVTLEGRVADDPRSYGGEFHFPLDPSAVVGRDGTEAWRGPRLLVSSPPTEIAAGEMVRVVGTATPGGGRYRGDPVAGRLEARSVEVVAPPGDPLFRIGNLLRERVHDGLDGFDGRPDAALLAGFLIGDVRELPAVDAEELRLAGLSHFVAVSGSNVALFLAA